MRTERKHVSSSWLRNKWRGLVQRFGPNCLKKYQWDKEFSSGKWDYLDKSSSSELRSQIERYANKGRVLDLGCGSGITGIELDSDSYSTYIGVDISEVAIGKARMKAEQCGRAARNEYYQANISSFQPSGEYNVIYFGESIYYLRFKEIIAVLQRYSQFLGPQGVILIRVFDSRTELNGRIVKEICRNFEEVEQIVFGPDFATLIAIRNR